MKKLISMILIATFSISTAAYAKEDEGKEFDLDFLIKVGQQYIDGFYESDRIANNDDYIVTDTSRAVYSIDKDIMAYILEIENKDGNEIGYVMVGSNETSPVILEASIEENLIGYLKDKVLSKELIYIAPLKLAILNKKKSNTYVDVRTNENYEFIFDEKKSKISKSEMELKNKESWKLIEETLTLQPFARSYVAPTVYMVNDEANFLKIPDSSKSTGYAYGGDQGWWENTSYSADNSCGPVAAANIAAYHALKYPSAYGDLFSGTLKKSSFLNHMNGLYDALNPGILGVPTTSQFKSGMTSYMYDCGVYTLNSHNVNASRYDVFVDGITQGLSHESPVAIVTWDPSGSDPYPSSSFAGHWITITKYYKDNNTQIEYFASSSWGKKYSLYLLDYWNSFWIEGGVYYW